MDFSDLEKNSHEDLKFNTDWFFFTSGQGEFDKIIKKTREDTAVTPW